MVFFPTVGQGGSDDGVTILGNSNGEQGLLSLPGGLF